MMDALTLIHDACRWLLAPISGGADHSVLGGVAWHGRLMVVAWLILAPLSIVIARFYKVTSGQDWPRFLDNPFWFIWHRRLGCLAGALMLVALGAIYWSNGAQFQRIGFHAIAGWCVMFFGAILIISALLRGTHGGPMNPMTRKPVPPEQWHGDHYSMTRRRIVFEHVHKSLGYVVLPLALLAILSGLWMADAPNWMWIVVAVISLVFVAIFVRLQRYGRRIDTYQAVWGIDKDLPGNRRIRPIGWGIRRHTEH
jgi:hypothetical protein